MKNVATTLAGRVGSTIVVLLLLVAIHIIGCGETEDPLELTSLAENTEVGVFAGEKYLDVAPGAPTAPTAPQGTPFVKAVKFFHDWQLTQPITAPVAVGSTIFIKVVFSEPMQLVVSDDEKARPILYHRRTGKGEDLVRFRMAAHGSKGEDFVPGDAKPLHSGTDDYICKYEVVPEDEGKGVAIMVGKFSVDREGNTLSEFYRHSMKLKVKAPEPVPVAKEPKPEPDEEVVVLPDPEPVEEVVALPEPEPEPFAHEYYRGTVVADILPPTAWVLNPPSPVSRYAVPSSRGGFVGLIAMPIAYSDDVTPVPNASVTITSGMHAGEQVLTDANGHFRFAGITDSNLYLHIEKAYLEPKEAFVSNAETTLVGLRYPDPVRFVLEHETLPDEVLLIETYRRPDQVALAIGGMYKDGVIIIINHDQQRYRIWYSVITHELAHARQHAIAMQHGSNDISRWDTTSEALAYKRAWDQDLIEAPRGLSALDGSDYYKTDLTENAAQFCSLYWLLIGIGLYEYYDPDLIQPIQGFRRRAPNRFKWAETYLNTRY